MLPSVYATKFIIDIYILIVEISKSRNEDKLNTNNFLSIFKIAKSFFKGK